MNEIVLDCLLEQAAVDLHRESRTPDTTPDRLTARVLDELLPVQGVPRAQIVELALIDMVYDLMTDLITVHGLLDPLNENSWSACSLMAHTLIKAIRAQDRQHDALAELIRDDIIRRVRPSR